MFRKPVTISLPRDTVDNLAFIAWWDNSLVEDVGEIGLRFCGARKSKRSSEALFLLNQVFSKARVADSENITAILYKSWFRGYFFSRRKALKMKSLFEKIMEEEKEILKLEAAHLGHFLNTYISNKDLLEAIEIIKQNPWHWFPKSHAFYTPKEVLKRSKKKYQEKYRGWDGFTINAK